MVHWLNAIWLFVSRLFALLFFLAIIHLLCFLCFRMGFIAGEQSKEKDNYEAYLKGVEAGRKQFHLEILNENKGD